MTDTRTTGMTIIVKTVTRFTLGFILLYGIYVALNGHMAPGGGFAGGVIVALSLVHVMLAFGKETAMKKFTSAFMVSLVAVAAILFLWVVAGGMFGTCVPFNLFADAPGSCKAFNSAVSLPLFEMAIVGFGLFAIFIALVMVEKQKKDGGDRTS